MLILVGLSVALDATGSVLVLVVKGESFLEVVRFFIVHT